MEGCFSFQWGGFVFQMGASFLGGVECSMEEALVFDGGWGFRKKS